MRWTRALEVVTLLFAGILRAQDTRVKPECPVPDVRIEIEHSAPILNVEAGLHSIVGYQVSDAQVNDGLVSAVSSQFAKANLNSGKVTGSVNDTLEAILTTSGGEKKHPVFDNGKVSALMRVPLPGTAFAGGSGMSIGGHALAIGRTARNPDIDLSTGDPIKGTGQEVGWTGGRWGASTPVKALTGDCWDKIMLIPKFSKVEGERREQKVTIVATVALVVVGLAEVSSRIVPDREGHVPDQVGAALAEFLATFAKSRQKALLKEPLALCKKMMEDGYEKAPGTVEAQASISFAGKISCGEKTKSLTLPTVTGDLNKGLRKDQSKFHPQSLEETREDVAQSAIEPDKTFVVLTVGSGKGEPLEIRGFGLGEVAASAVHRAAAHARLQTYFVVVWAALVESSVAREFKCGVHLHWVGFAQSPTWQGKDASEESQVEDLLRSELRRTGLSDDSGRPTEKACKENLTQVLEEFVRGGDSLKAGGLVAGLKPQAARK